MPYLDLDKLAAIDPLEFQNRKPYPWLNPEGILTDPAFETLASTLPDVDRFDRFFGVQRSHGQQPHDRYVLEYDDDMELAPPWREFIAELSGPVYQAFLRRMFGRGGLRLAFHWHYTPNGCSVSPHCDAMRKLGSHIFYLNKPDEWDPSWGGQTVILDDDGRFDRKSAPKFEDFDRAIDSESLGNRSLLFARREKSWHGVREIRAPEGRYRKVFIVVIEDWARSVQHRVISRLRGRKASSY
jgi:hypothetical protein